MPAHKDLTGSDLHEPKGIDIAVTGDAGKVITPGAITDGVSELRYLKQSEISQVVDYYTVYINDISGSDSGWVVIPYAGTLTDVHMVVDGAISTTAPQIEVWVGATQVTLASNLTIATGGAAGDTDNQTPTGTNTLAADDTVELRIATSAGTAVAATFTLAVQRD